MGVAAGDARERSIRARNSSETAAGRSFFSSVSSSEKSSMGLQGFLERAERIAVARGGGVLRNFQDAPDFGESELVPDFQNEDFPLFVRQTFHRGGEHLLTFVRGCELRFEMRSLIERDGRFAPGAVASALFPIRKNHSCGCKIFLRAPSA